MLKRQTTDETHSPASDMSIMPKRQKIGETHTPPSDRLAAPSEKPGFTLRILNISTTISKDQFLKILNSLPSETPPNEQNVLGWSLTPSAVSADALARSSQVATVTFHSAPPSLRYSPVSRTLDLLGDTIVDYNFFGMTPLSNPARAVVDIIAITGLAGHAFGSWKSRSTNTMWLRDLLPKHAPNARILTYGYDSTLLNNKSNASIHEFSELFFQALATVRASEEEKSRPIIFIAHSLGGLVIKHVLCNYRSVLVSCVALLLFGVPHHGLNVEALMSMVKAQPNAKLLEDLDESSSFLSLLEQFWKSQKTGGIKIISIYETMPTPTVEETAQGWKRSGREAMMVKKHSATAASKDLEDTFPIDRNHSDLVKFGNQECEYYKIVKKRIDDLVKDVQEGQWVSLEKVKRQEILCWLLTIEFKDHHSFNRERRQPGSGSWLLENDMWKKWAKEDESSILWLRGDAGSGKTMLASYVIDTLKVEAESNDHILAYFYCDYKEPRRREPVPILNTILKQFCLKVPPNQNKIPKPILDEYRKRENQGHVSGALNLNECKDLLLALSNYYLKTTIIIDALDECYYNTRGGLLNTLKFIVSMSRSKVKIFIASRYHDDIERAFSGTIHYYLCAEDNKKDIESFIEEEIDRRCEPGKLRDTDLPLLLGKVVTPELRKEVISTLKSRSCGMFLWAQLQIVALCKERTYNGVRKALQELPETLTETYNRMLHPDYSVHSDRDRLQRQHILRFLMSVHTKCSAQLLVQSLAIQFGGEELDEDLLCLERSDILAICQNFVVYNNALKTMEFAHFSVKEFLLRVEGFDDRACYNMMAAICLTALLFHNQNKLMQEIVHYATLNWSIYLTRADCLSRVLSKMWKQFLTDSVQYRDWLLKIGIHTSCIQGPGSQVLSPFWVACYYNLVDIARAMLENGVDVNEVSRDGQTPLISAAESNNTNVVKLLLQCEKVDVNLMGRNGQTPLHSAVQRGSTEVVKLMLACDKVDVNRVGRDGRTPLHWAVERGGTEVVSLMLACDKVDVNHVGRHGRTPLHSAVQRGSTEVVKLMLACDKVDVNRVGRDGRTPLHWAVERGDTEVVSLMLACDKVDVNHVGRHGRTPLHRAVERGDTEVVRLMLACDKVDVNHVGRDGRTPLHRAVERGGTEMVRLMLACDKVDVNRVGSDGQTPLISAAESNNTNVVKLLLQCEKVDVNLMGRNGQTPLHRAVQRGSTEVVKLMLWCEKVDVNHVGRDGRTILTWAVSRDDRTLVDLLLACDRVDVNCKDHHGVAPLSLALRTGSTAMIKLLCQSDRLDVNANDKDGQRALSFAIDRCDINLMKLLLGFANVDVNYRVNGGQTPLLLAIMCDLWCRCGPVRCTVALSRGSTNAPSVRRHPAVERLVREATIHQYPRYLPFWPETNYPRDDNEHRHREILNLLLMFDGIDVNMGDSSGQTPLIYAASKPNGLGIMKLLLQSNRINVNCQDHCGLTPLLHAVKKGHTESVKLLLSRQDIDPNIADVSHPGPLRPNSDVVS